MDLIIDLPTIEAEYTSVYTVVDRLSKYIYFIPCNVIISADDLAQLFLANLMYMHGMPKRIISNGDPRFTSGSQT